MSKREQYKIELLEYLDKVTSMDSVSLAQLVKETAPLKVDMPSREVMIRQLLRSKIQEVLR